MGKDGLSMSNDGDANYANNSNTQARSVDQIKPSLLAALHRMLLPNSRQGPVVVVDFGCAFGPNTLQIISFIVDALKERYEQAGTTEAPLFRACFSDLPSNDFNALFRLLTSAPRNYFGEGVPGSFYEQLLPKASVHVAFSSFSVQWLSKIPSELENRSSKLEDMKVLANQSEQDLHKFLSVRAEEVVSGGLMALLVPARELEVPQMDADEFLLFFTAQCTMQEMVSEGLIEPHLAETFHFGTYVRCETEIRKSLETFKGVWSVDEIQGYRTPLLTQLNDSDEEIARLLTLNFKAFQDVVYKNHLGKQTAEVFWERVEKNVLKSLACDARLKDSAMFFFALILTRQ